MVGLNDRIEAARIAHSQTKAAPLIGRPTARRNGSVSGATGQTARVVKRFPPIDPQPNTTLARLQAAYLTGLSIVDRAEEYTATTAKDARLTPKGRRDAVMRSVLHNLIPDAHNTRQTIKNARAEVLERKSKLTVDGPDKSDIAAAFRRQEIRDLIREMKSADLPRFLARADLATEIAVAVLEMPAEFSGVPRDQHERLRQRVLTERFGPELAELAQIELAIAAAESTVEIGRDELRLEIGGLSVHEFNALAAPIEAKHAAPWLRRRGGEVHVVDLERRVERQPTDEELAIGIFADTHDEYLKEQTTVPAAA